MSELRAAAKAGVLVLGLAAVFVASMWAADHCPRWCPAAVGGLSVVAVFVLAFREFRRQERK